MATATATGFVPVAKTGALQSGTMMSARVEGKELLIARAGDSYYAAENICPHMGATLSQGKLEGTVVTCPRHASKFDLVDGRVIRWTDWTGVKASVSKLFRSPRPLTVYPVKVEGEDILVQLKA